MDCKAWQMHGASMLGSGDAIGVCERQHSMVDMDLNAVKKKKVREGCVEQVLVSQTTILTAPMCGPPESCF